MFIAGMTAFYMFRLYYGIFLGAQSQQGTAWGDSHVPHPKVLLR